MKIILATPIYPPAIGGPAEYARELPRRLTLAHTVTTIAYTDNAPDNTVVSISPRIPLPFRLFLFFYHVWKESHNADIIYAQNAVAAGLPAVLAGMLRKKPVIIKFVGDEAWERASLGGATTKLLPAFLKQPEGGWRTTLFMRIQRFTLQHATHITTPSRYLGELITEVYQLPPSAVTTNYNAAGSYAPLTIPVRKPHSIATAVRLVSWKGVAGIIDAVSLLTDRYPDIMLTIAGDGPLRTTLEAHVRAKRLMEHVTFLGNISREETERLYASSAAMVLNSSYEGLPFGALMSFATHTPVIATNIPGTDEVITDGETGLLIPTRNTEALAHALDRLFTDEMLRTSLAANAAARLAQKFSWDAHIEKLLHIFSHR